MRGGRRFRVVLRSYFTVLFEIWPQKHIVKGTFLRSKCQKKTPYFDISFCKSVKDASSKWCLNCASAQNTQFVYTPPKKTPAGLGSENTQNIALKNLLLPMFLFFLLFLLFLLRIFFFLFFLLTTFFFFFSFLFFFDLYVLHSVNAPASHSSYKTFKTNLKTSKTF